MSSDNPLGRAHLLVHALLGSYSETAGSAATLTAAQPLRQRLLELDVLLAQARAEQRNARRHLPRRDPDAPPPPDSLPIVRWQAERDRTQRTLNRLWQHDEHRTRPGLLIQLAATARLALTAPNTGEGRAGKPGSRPPAALEHLELLRKVRRGVADHDHTIRGALADPATHPRPWTRMLWDLPTLASRLPTPDTVDDQPVPVHPLLRALLTDLSWWRSTCRVQLGYTAPKVTLSTPCPHCQQQALIVREDATSDVVCTTPTCIDPSTGQLSRWPRSAWDALLTGRIVQGLVNTDAAALHVGVSPATLRDWKRRGLIRPAVDEHGVPLGTTRQPLWRLAELAAALDAAKPRRVEPEQEQGVAS